MNTNNTIDVIVSAIPATVVPTASFSHIISEAVQTLNSLQNEIEENTKKIDVLIEANIEKIKDHCTKTFRPFFEMNEDLLTLVFQKINTDQVINRDGHLLRVVIKLDHSHGNLNFSVVLELDKYTLANFDITRDNTIQGLRNYHRTAQEKNEAYSILFKEWKYYKQLLQNSVDRIIRQIINITHEKIKQSEEIANTLRNEVYSFSNFEI